jgi:hypothetical protein
MTQGNQIKYFNWYLCFTNYADQPRYLLIPGQQEFSSAINAYQEEIQDLDLSGFNPQELVFGYQLTFFTSNAYSNKGKCRLTREPQAINVARVSSSISGGSIDHNTTAGLQGGNGIDEFYHLTAANHGYIDQDVTATGAPTFAGLTMNGDILFGSDKMVGSAAPSTYGALRFRATAQTPDTPLIMTGSISNAYVLCEYADRSYDFAHALQTNPTLFIQSANPSATEWLSLAHNQTVGLISAGTGLSLTTGGNGDFSIVTNGTGITKVGSGSPGHLTPTSGELYVQGKCEFDGDAFFDDDLLIATSKNIHHVTGNGSLPSIILGNGSQSPSTSTLSTGTNANSWIICEYADKFYNFAHALQTNPTLFIQSANQSATEWLSLAHNQTVGLISAGTGIEIATGANGDFTVDTASTERFKITGTTGIHHFPTTSMFSAYCDASFALSDASYTDVIFETEIYDVSNEYDHTTGIFTATEGGKYQCSWGLLTEDVSWTVGEICHTSLVKNNSTTLGNQFFGHRWAAQASVTEGASSQGSVDVILAASDTLRIKAYHNQGASINTVGVGAYCYFTVHKFA